MAKPLTNLVPLLFVADPERSIAFYARLGFEVPHKLVEGDRVRWAWLKNGGAQLMVSLASAPVDREEQAVMFYVYTPDISGRHAMLQAAEVPVGPIETPFWSPRGEFRVVDPDGYALMFSHDD